MFIQKKLYFVLQPQRKDFVTDEPIIISKKEIISAIKKFVYEKGRKYSYFPSELLDGEVTHHLDRALKGFMLPMQMLNLSLFYLDNSVKRKTDIMFEEKMYHLIQYSLLASKITYDQNDYYKIFGRSSNVFDTISLVRNSLAHDNIQFVDNAQNVSYVDRDRTLSESVGLSASKLLIVDMQKQMLMNLNGKTKPENVEDLTTRCKEIFDFFFGGTYDFEELIDCIAEEADEMK